VRDGDGFDPYKTLQVDPEAEQEVIEAAYRRLARKYHPDMAPAPETAERMVVINRAWEILRDSGRRAQLDRDRQARARTSEAFGSQAGATGNAPGRTTSTRAPDPVSRDWSSGRSSYGGGYDKSMRAATSASPPPGNPSGSVLGFGRYAGWSLGEVARTDMEYIEWLDRMPIGRPYRDEIDGLLRRAGRRISTEADAKERRGLFRRR